MVLVIVCSFSHCAFSQLSCQDPVCGSSGQVGISTAQPLPAPTRVSLLPPPASPRNLAQCAAYQAQLNGQFAEIGREHEACLDSYKADRQGDNNLVCSRSECQSLHTLLYGGLKEQGDQQVASCEAAVHRYEARQGAEQLGIQTLGNALANALTSNPASPIDSQSDLADYEEQQRGQAVLGDGSSFSSSTESAATDVMSSGGQAGSSAQAQLDAAVDNALANTPSPILTPPLNTSSANDSTTLPPPIPSGLPNPDPALYPPLTPAQYQVMDGAQEVIKGCFSLSLICYFPPAEGAAAFVGTALAVQNTASDLVVGGVNLYSGNTGHTAIGEQNEQNFNAYGTTLRAVGTIVSGNPQTGQAFNTFVSGVFSTLDLNGLWDGSLPQAIKGLDAAKSVWQGANAFLSLLPSQPPNGAYPGVSAQPVPPNQATTGQQGSNNLPAAQPAPVPAPSPIPNP